MADITEDEAVLHLKRALGELDGEVAPAPLPVVQPPAPKVAKKEPKPVAPKPPSLLGAPLGPTLGPPLGLPGGPQLGPPVGPQVGPPVRPLGPPPQQQPPRQQRQPPQQQRGQAAPAPELPPPGLPPFPGMPAGMPAGMPFPVPDLGARPPGPCPGRLPPGPQAPAPQPQPAPSAPNAQQQAMQAAAAPGKSLTQFDIPQDKVGLVIGKQSATQNAIKAYSKAQMFVDQRTPDEEHARIYVVGSDSEVGKCKQTIMALVDGTMSAATLFSLAGMKEPAGGAEDKSHGRAPPASAAMPPPAAMGLPPGAPLPPMMGGMPPAPGGVIPGLPENAQMQQNLNDYYARLWSTYAGGTNKPEHPPTRKAQQKPAEPLQAFDPEALKKLAERAASGEPEEDLKGMAPPSSMFPGMPPQGDLSSMPPPMAGGKDGPPPLSGLPVPSGPGSCPGMPAPPSRTTELGQFKGFQIPRATEPPKAQKDQDSVAKMMEQLQGNVQKTKETVAQPLGRPDANARAAFGGMGQGGQSQVDYEFEAFISRVQSAQSPEEFGAVAREVLIRFGSLPPHQVTELLQKMDGRAAGSQHGELMAELSRLVVPRMKEFTSTQFTTLMSTFASWSASHMGKQRQGRFADASKGFFAAASMEMSSRLMQFAPHEINCCLAAFVSVGFADNKFFGAVGRAALARHGSFAPVQLTALLAILSEMRLVHVDLFNAAAQFLASRVKELRPVDVMRVLRSFAKCGVQHEQLCRVMGDEVVLRSQDRSTFSFKVEDLCELSWFFCMLQQYHEPLFRLMFKELETAPMVSADALLQVYECHLALDCERKDYYSKYRVDADIVDQLHDHYRDNRKDERRCSKKHRNDVAAVLKSLVDGSVHVNHRTSTGLLVDVAALRKRSSTDGFIHVDLDSTVTTVRALDQDEANPASLVTEGAVALRRAILAKHGLRLITVRESEWRDLDDSKDKRRYLRQMLSSLGDVLE
mmetsp:Transcript_61269/g.145865  ORF Transcript_61269/g.145865 Transcript_61269/m.145865 type:complete len:974 (+) Transcript_61269:123-3044(+)|eukprot:CAMPEP_0178438290 /NCGR_PEP_ID=MMETSP0689_2-20121128/35511_1 /TAXON_ID=160604 /ORGANISM="Amphidinium massartii, Strain CS-259" /LENGTH=973 /DNA_ID=CAMNT_0020060677 /DNA_START=44 /DNA_END=2965 /DNA_ORIENTATION=+